MTTHSSKKRLLVGCLLIIVGLGGLVYAFLQWREQSSLQRAGPHISSAPSTARPTAASIAGYTVPPDDPKYITINSIEVDKTRVLKLGVLKDGAIATPGNVYDTGWYGAGGQPGKPGTVFIFGHVSSWQTKGVFYNLKKLAQGDRIAITTGNNKVYTYQVDHTQVYPHDRVDMKQVLSVGKPGTSNLSLMTCTGKVIKGTSEFDQRLVVSAFLVK